MSITQSPKFLRYVLFADSASCLTTGAAQVMLAGPLAEILGLPWALLMGTGVFLLGYAAFVALVATRHEIPRGLVWLLVAGNFGWAAGCVALLAAAPLHPSTLGQAWVIAQAVMVVVLAEMQWAGLRTRAAGWA